MSRGVTLQKSTQTVYNSNSGNGFRFTITATSGLNIPNEIFRYRKQLYNITTNDYQDVFDGICTAEQLVSLPVNAAADDDVAGYFRKAAIDVVVPTRKLADEMWADIQDDVQTLITAMNQQDILTPAMSVRIGDA